MATKSRYWKNPKYGQVYINDEALAVPTCRVSWVHLKAPKPPMKGDDGREGISKYEVTFVLRKDDPAVKTLNKAIQLMAKGMIEYFNKGNPAKLGSCDSFKDGDAFDHEKNPHYKDCWVLVARHKDQPSIISTEKVNGKYVKLDPSKILGGMKCKAIVSPLISAKGISYQLITVQLVEDDGVRYGGGAPNPDQYNKLFDDGAEDSDDESDETDGDDDDSSDDHDSVGNGSNGDSDEDEEVGEDDEEELPKATKRRGRPAGKASSKESALDNI